MAQQESPPPPKEECAPPPKDECPPPPKDECPPSSSDVIGIIDVYDSDEDDEVFDDDVRHVLFSPSWAKQELEILEELANALPNIMVKEKKDIPMEPKLEALPRAIGQGEQSDLVARGTASSFGGGISFFTLTMMSGIAFTTSSRILSSCLAQDGSNRSWRTSSGSAFAVGRAAETRPPTPPLRLSASPPRFLRLSLILNKIPNMSEKFLHAFLYNPPLSFPNNSIFFYNKREKNN